MPAVAARTLVMSPDEYLVWEPTQTERHEYHFGEVFPMPGDTSEHAELIIALGALLYMALRGSECSVRAEAMRVQISPEQYVYADLTVTCGEALFATAARTSLVNPTLVVEALSKSTRAYDRDEKLDLYRSVESVQEILFVDSERRRVETVRRTEAGWVLSEPQAAGTLALASVNVGLDLDALYEGIVA